MKKNPDPGLRVVRKNIGGKRVLDINFQTCENRCTLILGKAMSVALHLRLLPFFLWRILKGNVPESNAIDLVVILARMLEYIMADDLSEEDIVKFEEIVVEFFEKRKCCAEEFSTFCKMTPKYHHLGI